VSWRALISPDKAWCFIVAGNSDKPAVAATLASIQLTTEQKHYIGSAISYLDNKANISLEEGLALNILKAILPEVLPIHTKLLANYPNPFNPETWIPFQLSHDASVTAKIYDAAGRQIRSLELGHLAAGSYLETQQAIYWNGRSQTGELVSSGTYFIQLQAGDHQETRKMVILK